MTTSIFVFPLFQQVLKILWCRGIKTIVGAEQMTMNLLPTESSGHKVNSGEYEGLNSYQSNDMADVKFCGQTNRQMDKGININRQAKNYMWGHQKQV